jgi:hypothetical protein
MAVLQEVRGFLDVLKTCDSVIPPHYSPHHNPGAGADPSVRPGADTWVGPYGVMKRA